VPVGKIRLLGPVELATSAGKAPRRLAYLSRKLRGRVSRLWVVGGVLLLYAVEMQS
jgi:hypothetical protein